MGKFQMWKVAALLLSLWLFDFGEANISGGITKFGVDTIDALTTEKLECVKKRSYAVMGVRLYNRGKHDEVGIANLKKAYNDGFNIQAYVVPHFLKSPMSQITEVVEYGKKHNLVYHKIFLKITEPRNWYYDPEANAGFVDLFVQEAKTLNVKIGIFTNWYDFKTIIGESKLINDTDLWYWNTLGDGETAETGPTFKDFHPFGPFKNPPAGKQFGTNSRVCGLTVNRNIFDGYPEESAQMFFPDKGGQQQIPNTNSFVRM